MERVLDVSGLAPPEPLEVILEALQDLPAADRLRVRHSREPFPLYNLLREMDFSWQSGWTDTGFEMVIWHAGTEPFDPESTA